MSAEPPIVLLDACVLAALTTRTALFAAAGAGLFQPRWSARIEEEWRRAALRASSPPPADVLAAEMAMARERFPAALVEGWETLEGPLWLPDWNDRHVLAAAIAAEADLLVTDNLNDFPARVLAGHGLRGERADSFLWRLLGESEPKMRAALSEITDRIGDASLPAALKRCRLPRFAKAVKGLG